MNVDIYVDLDIVGKMFKGTRGRILGISPNTTIIEALGFIFIICNLFNLHIKCIKKKKKTYCNTQSSKQPYEF